MQAPTAENFDTRSKWSAGEFVGAACFGVFAFLLWLHAGMVSLTDYSNWTYQGVLLQHHLLGRPDAAHWFKPYPVPNSAATLGIGVLALVMPWLVAAKVWMCVQMSIAFVTLRYLLRTLGATGWAWVILPIVLFFNVNFWYGFANFELGLCWVMLIAALLLRSARGERPAEWLLGVVLLLAFFTHMIPFAFCGLLLFLYAAQTKRWKVLRQLLPAAMLCVWYVYGRFVLAGNADGQAGMASSVANYSLAFWAFKANSYVKSFGFANPESSLYLLKGDILLLILFTANAVLAIIMGLRMISSAKSMRRQSSSERFLWLAVVLMLPAFLLAPGEALGVSDPGARLLQVALALALPMSLRRSTRLVQVAGVCSSLLYVAGLYLFSSAAFHAYGEPVSISHLPQTIRRFANVPNHDQDVYIDALRRGDLTLPVFPTSMVLNGNPPQGHTPFTIPQR